MNHSYILFVRKNLPVETILSKDAENSFLQPAEFGSVFIPTTLRASAVYLIWTFSLLCKLNDRCFYEWLDDDLDIRVSSPFSDSFF